MKDNLNSKSSEQIVYEKLELSNCKSDKQRLSKNLKENIMKREYAQDKAERTIKDSKIEDNLKNKFGISYKSDLIDERMIKNNKTKDMIGSVKENWEKFRKLDKRDKINDSDTENSDFREEQNVKWIINTDNTYKILWDIYIAIILIYSALVTPYQIAFIDDTIGLRDSIIEYLIYASFLVDIILNFFSAFVDNEDNVIVKRKKIIKNYLVTWFIIDLLSMIPINLFIDSVNQSSTANNGRVSNAIAKVARIPKLYRLIRLTKLFRIVKIIKRGNVGRITKYFLEKMKMSANIEKLIYFILSFLILNHISSCIWYLIAKLQDLSPDCWVVRCGYIDFAPIEIYIVAFYWNLTTITTVGYGDVSAGTTIERIYSLFIMSFGVFMYSFAIGSLSSIVSSLDSKTAEMNHKLQTLYSIKQEFKLDGEIYNKVRKVIKFDLSRNQKDKINFLHELPNKLRIELSQIIHDNIIKKLHFFLDASPDLIAFVTPLIKPLKSSQNEILYKIGDTMDERSISFNLSFNFGNKEIKLVKKNSNFGEIEMCFNEKLSHLIKVKSRNAELFVFKKNDFLKLSFNFKEFVESFLQRSIIHYMKFNDEKKKNIQEYELEFGEVQSPNQDEFLGKILEEDEDKISEEYDVFGNHSEESGDKKKKKSIRSSNSNIRVKTKSQEKTEKLEYSLSDSYSDSYSGSIDEEKISKKINRNTLKSELKLKNDSIKGNLSKNGSIRKEIEKNTAPNVKEVKTTIAPILELNEFIEKIKEDLFNNFSIKIEKIIQYLIDNEIKFEDIAHNNDNNPINILKKLSKTKDINERNEIIDYLEHISSQLK